MQYKNAKKEVCRLLKNMSAAIVEKWSESVFNVPGFLRDKDMITKKAHTEGMRVFFKNLISDIMNPKLKRCEYVFKRLILKDYLSASNAADVIQALMLLRSMLLDLVSSHCGDDIEKLKTANKIIIEAMGNNIVCVSDIYKKRDFARLQTIMMYGKKMIRMQDIDELCELILKAAVMESGSDRASLMLVEKDDYMRIKSSVGIPRNIAAKARVRIGSGISGMVAKTGEPIIINKGHEIPKGVKRYMRGLKLRSALSVPIMSNGFLLGVLNLGKYKNKHLFDKDDAGLLMILAHEAGTAISNCRLFQEMHELYEGSIFSLAAAIDARDHYTHGHSSRVTDIAVEIGKKLKLPEDTLKKIRLASMLHDIGKIGIPDSVLLKPSRLTSQEFDIIKKHPIYAVNILKHLPRLKDVVPIVYHEHERFDGQGYVSRLKGDAIPIESRVIAVADAFEAMTSNRPYRKSMFRQKAIDEIRRNAGTQFDPVVARAFLKIMKQ
ncbi:MAG: GAF domain-containing protein [Candidatus Omnitrophica bacterium]|nr:GAF domain-containing protein [Candidatus Omnitrophota bacterium]